MNLLSKRCQIFLAGSVLLLVMFFGTAAAAVVPVFGNAAQLLKQADSIKTSNHAEFAVLMQQLGDSTQKLSPEQQLYLRYLNAWQVGYNGDYETAIPQLNAVIAESADATLRFRAGVTKVNFLAIGSRYEEAFVQLSQLLDQLPQITDKDARVQGFGVAAILYNGAGQYDLASGYGERLLKENPTAANICKGEYFKLDALNRVGKLRTIDQQFQDGVDTCVKAAEPIFANLIRSIVASFDIQQGRYAAAIGLLQKNLADVRGTGYAALISQFDALLAEAYWKESELALSQQFAISAINSGVKNEYTESLTIAYKVLYLIAQKQGDMGAALAYHERYMGADKGYLSDVSAKALAYQIVSQQVLAKKLQIDTLNKQNQILQLQQTLAKKEVVTSRLYVVLLLIVLASIALWTYKIKRSQLRFMKLARRDGLTGIFNRQHFVSEAELQLQYCRKSSRDACLVLIDLDHFKAVNDNHGHAVGDRVLKRAVETCQAHLRSTDIFGRLGGEEFGILLPDCTLEQALGRAEQIRQTIATTAPGGEAPGIPVSASFGIASVIHSGYELRQLLIHADEALYQAKREGRNRVSVSVGDMQEACAQTG